MSAPAIPPYRLLVTLGDLDFTSEKWYEDEYEAGNEANRVTGATGLNVGIQRYNPKRRRWVEI